MRQMLLMLPMLMLVGCTHIKGVVLQDPTQRPMTTAVISVGRPTGIAVYDQHKVDDHGRFDFYIGPTDEENLYIYDGASRPEMTMRRIQSYELGEKMELHLRPALQASPSLPVDTNINF